MLESRTIVEGLQPDPSRAMLQSPWADAGQRAERNVAEIVTKFGGADELRNAVSQLQSLLYAT